MLDEYRNRCAESQPFAIDLSLVYITARQPRTRDDIQRMITLPQQIDHEIRFSCEKLFPEEACGVLMGRVLHGVHYVAHALELHNSSPVHRDERYVITPMQYQYATRIARERRLEMIGFYHSHPNRR